MSAVTFAEARAKLLLRGIPADEADRSLSELTEIIAFNREIGQVAADLVFRFRRYDFSLGDCCLATGIVLDEVILTSDRDWLAYETGAKVELIR